MYILYIYIYLCSFLSSPHHQIYSDDVVDVPVGEIQLSSSQLRHFAREAQLTGDYQQAVRYYQEVQ